MNKPHALKILREKGGGGRQWLVVSGQWLVVWQHGLSDGSDQVPGDRGGKQIPPRAEAFRRDDNLVKLKRSS